MMAAAAGPGRSLNVCRPSVEVMVIAFCDGLRRQSQRADRRAGGTRTGSMTVLEPAERADLRGGFERPPAAVCPTLQSIVRLTGTPRAPTTEDRRQ